MSFLNVSLEWLLLLFTSLNEVEVHQRTIIHWESNSNISNMKWLVELLNVKTMRKTKGRKENISDAYFLPYVRLIHSK